MELIKPSRACAYVRHVRPPDTPVCCARCARVPGPQKRVFLFVCTSGCGLLVSINCVETPHRARIARAGAQVSTSWT
jgi:hypothetical protein